MRNWLIQARAALKRLQPLLPGFRDLHIYGGGALMGIGAAAVYAPAGPIVIGVLLVFLGLRRPRS